jgi:hypothetical protein
MPHFERYIGIDDSGAVTPDSSCKGLRVAEHYLLDERKMVFDRTQSAPHDS